MSDIFISYKREEKSAAGKLADALEEQGWSVWWDPKLQAGDRFDDVIEKALTKAKCVIVLWSRSSVKSDYVIAEASYALESGKLLPLAIEKVDLPFRFKRRHTPRLIDLDGSWSVEVFQRLIVRIAAIVEPSPPKAPTKKPQKVNEEAREAPEPEHPSEPEEKCVETEPGLVLERLDPGTEFQDTLSDGSSGPIMVVIPAGTFRMGNILRRGSSHEDPVHGVTVRNFAIGKYPVTFADYDRFAKATTRELPGDKGWGRGNHPVINVSWEEAVAYAEWLSREARRSYRLPSEAEWEYAARAGTETDYWWGNRMKSNMANKRRFITDVLNSGQTTLVGSFPANPFGLHDTAGNVWEWVQDCWYGNYAGAPNDGSAWLGQGGADCAQRVSRGGSWNDGRWELRSASRNGYAPGYRYTYIGFRLARDL